MPAETLFSRRLLWSLRGWVLLLLILHLAAPRFGEAMAWGLWPVTFVTPPVRWALALSVAILCLPPVSSRLLAVLRPLTRSPQMPPSPPWRLFTAAALLSLPIFWTWRLAHTRWGDAYLLTNAISYPDPALRLVFTWQAPATVFWHAQLWALGQRLWQWPDAFLAYALTSTAAGGVFVLTALLLAWEVGRTRGQRLLLAGLLLSLGTMQLFFGYVENYSLPAAAILLYLWLAARCLTGKTPLWLATLVLAMAHGLHPSTLNLAPSLLILMLANARRRGWPRTLLHAAGPLLLVGAGVILLMEAGGHGIAALLTSDRPGGGDARWLVPLWTTTTRWEHYTMFSWGHLLDIANQQLLSAPISLAAALLSVPGWRYIRPALAASAAWLPAYARFLIVAAAGSLLFIWLWNPDYGGQRDWDLFSLASLPLTVLAGLLVGHALNEEGDRWQAALPLLGAAIFHSAAWIFQNTRPWEWS